MICRFGRRCKRMSCVFLHSQGRVIGSDPSLAVEAAVESEPAVEAAEVTAEESEPAVELLRSPNRLMPACLASIDAADPASVHRRSLLTPASVAAFDAAVCASGQHGESVICMVKVEAQLRAEIARLIALHG